VVDLRLSIAAGAALVCGPWLFVRGFRHLRTCRVIRDTPTARIRSMAMGRVELHGEVIPRSGITAPFSGHSCAYWEVDIAVRGRRNTWTMLHRNQSGGPFYLRDETGVAMVFPHGAECQVHYQRQEECVGLALPYVYSQYLSEHASPLVKSAGRLSVLRFRERILEQGMSVYVLGCAAPRSQSHMISDGELEATGTDDIRGRRVQSLDAAVAAVVVKGGGEVPFLISQRSERELIQRLQWKSTAMLVGGPGLTLLGLAYFLAVLSSARPW
jgi:hypothetical protein